tara:strand:- start:32986 stop:33153 length:168 start_codon:yes stop_codon:yes gene_type:complete
MEITLKEFLRFIAEENFYYNEKLWIRDDQGYTEKQVINLFKKHLDGTNTETKPGN